MSPVPVETSAAPRRRHGVGLPLAVLGVVVAGAIAHVAVSAKHVEAGIEVGRARRERDELQALRRRLEIEIGVLKDPGRISRLAQETLHMGPPAPERIVRPERLPPREPTIATEDAAGAPRATGERRPERRR